MMFYKFFSWFQQFKFRLVFSHNTVVPRTQHRVSRKNISKNALKVLKRLQKHGYQAYLVGGGIRDLLLDHLPKDFDIVTSASPEEIKSIFCNAHIIGRRFRLVHICFSQEIIEVSTLRTGEKSDEQKLCQKTGMVKQDNVFGDKLEEDAARRDFTINALYYSLKDFSLIDYIGAMKDIKKQRLRLIGDPKIRFREDPVRILRAIRFTCKLHLKMDRAIYDNIIIHRELLVNVPAARLYEEYKKMFLSSVSYCIYKKLKLYSLVEVFFYFSKMNKQQLGFTDKIAKLALQDTDKRFQEGNHLSPVYLVAVILWPQLLPYKRKCYKIWQNKCHELLDKQRKKLGLPRFGQQMILQIWLLQWQFHFPNLRNVQSLFEHSCFRAAFDLLQLRFQAGDKTAVADATWWKKYVHADKETRWNLVQKIENSEYIRKKPSNIV